MTSTAIPRSMIRGSVVIREKTRVGSHTTILPGIEIGLDAVVGSHSLVQTDILAVALTVGVRAEISKHE